MSRSQNLRHNVINQVINDMARGFIPSPLPSQSALAEMYNISRTTVRHILCHLCERGVLSQVNFKPETDDMREAPALVAIDRLTRAGAAVRVYDPAAMDECRRRVGDAVVYCSDMYEAVVDADALVLLTEWKQFRLPSWTVIRKVMANPLVIDGRNIYDKAELVAEGFTYKAIGK